MRTAASRARRSHVPRDRGLRDGEGFRTKQRNSSVIIPGGILTRDHATPGFCRWQTPVVAFFPHHRRLAAGRLQVGVAVELALVEPLEHLAFRQGHAPGPDPPLAV